MYSNTFYRRNGFNHFMTVVLLPLASVKQKHLVYDVLGVSCSVNVISTFAADLNAQHFFTRPCLWGLKLFPRQGKPLV